MDLVTLLIVLIIVGAVLYVVRLLPLHGTIQTIIQVVVIVAVAIWVLRHFVGAI